MKTSDQVTPQLVIGVDGGQSATQTVLATTEGEILAAAVTGPVTHLETAGGSEQVRQVLHQGYKQVLAMAGVEILRVGCIHLGLSGVNDLEFIKSIYQTDRLTESGDAHIALMGAFPDNRVGVIVTAGTGSNAYGRRADGLTAFAGGRGYYLGDEGGGCDIAQQAFRATYQAADGRSEETALTTLILSHFQCRDLEQLLLQIYAHTYSRDQLASVSRLVGQAATEGDVVAIRILAHAGHELGKAVTAVLRTLGQTDTPFPVAQVGSVFNAGEFVTRPMMARVRDTNPQAYLVEARFPPAVGAVISALLDLGIAIDERILRNIKHSEKNVRLNHTKRKE
jgi:N-acetylglucosamine kinase-like BadF-type ATPase